MSELSKKTEKDLQKDLGTLNKALWDFRVGLAGSKVRNVKEGRATKRQIARVLTELTNRTK
jgi:ribosomal protein L29